MTTYIPYRCFLCGHETWKKGICRYCSNRISALTFAMLIGLVIIWIFLGCASIKAPKTHVQTVASQIMPGMTLGELTMIRPIVYYKSKTLGIELYEVQHLTVFGKIPFLTRQTIAYKDTIRAYPCQFRVRASKDGRKWSEWSKMVLIN